MVPAPAASGAVGTGRYCGHRAVRADSPVSGHLRSALWMLLRPKSREPEEEAEDKVAGWGHLNTCEGN